MKHIILTLAILSLFGCEGNDMITASKSHQHEKFNERVQEICYDGVTYLISGYYRKGYMSVKFNRNGSVATCLK
jgi:hypothetical protein